MLLTNEDIQREKLQVSQTPFWKIEEENGREVMACQVSYFHLPGYAGTGVVENLLQIQTLLNSEPDVNQCILKLLDNTSNWRVHNVAFGCLLFVRADPYVVEALWSAIKGHSWSSPQLVVAAFIQDDSFHANAFNALAYEELTEKARGAIEFFLELDGTQIDGASINEGYRIAKGRYESLERYAEMILPNQ